MATDSLYWNFVFHGNKWTIVVVAPPAAAAANFCEGLIAALIQFLLVLHLSDVSFIM